jgi:predicted enzyme related to lactoylglutathione lyase
MTGELSFFELGVGDIERARRFYGILFDREFVNEGNGADHRDPERAGRHPPG